MENGKKNLIFSDFVIFPTVGNNENKKKIFIMKKKKFSAENVGWATAQLYCKGWKYCIVRVGLYRDKALEREELYCKI